MRLRRGEPVTSTFSIVARDEQHGDLGIAVASKYLAVGAVVPYATAGIGALATQSRADLGHGPQAIEMLAHGRSPAEIVLELVRDDPDAAIRQIGLVDSNGRAASYSGESCIPWSGGVIHDGFCCQGNILAGAQVLAAMADGYRDATGEFPERLVAALIAGHDVGGDRRGQQSAALYVVRGGGRTRSGSDRPIDLRVDNHPTPLLELQRLLALHRLTFNSSYDPPAQPDPVLLGLVHEQLRALGYLTGDQADVASATRDALSRFAADAQLEEWLASPRNIDETILDALRMQLGNASLK